LTPYGGLSKSGEIDVMETIGHEQTNYLGLFMKNYAMVGQELKNGGNIALSKDDRHTFEINWEEDLIQFAVGGHI
jgi:hypothetical protein